MRQHVRREFGFPKITKCSQLSLFHSGTSSVALLKVFSLPGASLKWQEQSAEPSRMSVISLSTAMEAQPTARMMFTSWMVTPAATARLIATMECARALIPSVNLSMAKVWPALNGNPFLGSWQTFPIFLSGIFRTPDWDSLFVWLVFYRGTKSTWYMLWKSKY